MREFVLADGATLEIAGWAELMQVTPTGDVSGLRVQLLGNSPCYRCGHAAWQGPRPVQGEGTCETAVRTFHRPVVVPLARGGAFTIDRWIRVERLRDVDGALHLGIELAPWAGCLWCGTRLHGTPITIRPRWAREEVPCCA
jgi:hypothetical protein